MRGVVLALVAVCCVLSVCVSDLSAQCANGRCSISRDPARSVIAKSVTRVRQGIRVGKCRGGRCR